MLTVVVQWRCYLRGKISDCLLVWFFLLGWLFCFSLSWFVFFFWWVDGEERCEFWVVCKVERVSSFSLNKNECLIL